MRNMTNKELFDLAYERLLGLYGGDCHTPDVRVLDRFFEEKMIMQENPFSVRYFELIGRLRQVAAEKGEHLYLSGTGGASFVAYLLGASETNPLPRHTRCPACGTTVFLGEGSPFDAAPDKCPCGADLITDGHGIPFASHVKSALAGRAQIHVSRAFLEEAKRFVYNEMWDYAILTLQDDEKSPVRFCFLDKEENEDAHYPLRDNEALFAHLPHLSLNTDGMLDKLRELERVTGYTVGEIGFPAVSRAFYSLVEEGLCELPKRAGAFMKELFDTVKPKSYDEILKVIGLAHSVNGWTENGEILFEEHRMTLAALPVFREDVFCTIAEKLRLRGMQGTGLAYEVMDKARRGYYATKGCVEENTVLSLLGLGFDMDFLFFLEKVGYLFPKAWAVACLRTVIRMTVYKTKFPQEYAEIMAE